MLVVASFGTILLVDLVVIILWPTMLRANRSVILGTAINIMAGSAYVLKLTTPAVFFNDIVGRRLLIGRYVVWNHTMSLMSVLLNLLTPVSPQVACWRIFQTMMCIQLGFWGTVDIGYLPASVLLICGSQYFLTDLCFSLYKALRNSVTFAWQRAVLGMFVFVAWHVFPVIWLGSALRLFSESGEFLLYSIGDVMAKVLITTTMLQGHVKVASDMLVSDFNHVSAERRMLQDDLKAMISVAGVPIIVTNSEGRIAVWNKQIAALSGISVAEAEGCKLWCLPLLSATSQQEVRASIERILSRKADEGLCADSGVTGSSITFELGFERVQQEPDSSQDCAVVQGDDAQQAVATGRGKMTLILVTASVTRDADGRTTGLICLGADMTAERERLIADADRARVEAMNDAKDKFLACMSHEMRTPLSALIGILQLIASKPPPDWKHDNLEYLITSSLRSAEHLYVLVCDVLDMSKVQHGKLKLSIRDFDLHEVIESVAGRCKHVLSAMAEQKRNVDFRVDVQGSMRVLRGDSQRIQQVLTNLGTNAIKYTMHGSVSLVVRVRELRGEELGGTGLEEAVRDEARECVPVELHVQVTDTGVGIPNFALRRIFDLFETVPTNACGASTAGRSSGGISSASGIGLTICKELANAMGGSLGVESTFGAGSTFTFVLNTLAFPNCQVADAKAFHRPFPVLDASPPPSLDRRLSQGAEDGPVGAPSEDKEAYVGKLMLVEDDDMNRVVISMFLEGHELCEAHNGLEAVVMVHERLAKGADLDMIVMDVNMPMLTGRQAAQLIRLMQLGVSPWAEHVPIVALTANAMDVELSRCLDAGMTDCLTKPVPQESVLQMVRKHVLFSRSSGHLKGECATRGASPKHPGMVDALAPLLREFVALNMTALQHQAGVRMDLERRAEALAGSLAWACDLLCIPDAHRLITDTVQACAASDGRLDLRTELAALVKERSAAWLCAIST